MKATYDPIRKLVQPLFAVWMAFVFVAPVVSAEDDAKSSEVDLAKIFAGQAPENVAELRAMQDHVRGLAEKLIPCTVGVRVGQAQGTGVIISEDGYVLTAGHVAGKPNRPVTFIFPDGKTARGKTLGVNRGIDSGLMKITDEGKWPHVEMGDSSELKTGQWCLAIGHPGGVQRDRKPVVRLGRVLINRDMVVVTDCPLIGGDSGGPLFDMDGKVIAIHSRIGSSLTANMHVPVATYTETWDRLANGEEWGNDPASGPYIGVRGEPEAENALIAEVVSGAAAEKAGVKVGDVITKFAGKDVTNFASLARLVGEKNPGDKVKIEVIRGEETKELTLVIGDRSEL